MSLGFAFGFAIAEIKQIDARVITLLCILVFSYVLYVLLELFISRFGDRCCKRREEMMVIDEGLKEKMLRNGDSSGDTVMTAQTATGNGGDSP